MCGIAGIFSRTLPFADCATIRSMIDVVAYRGPDGQGHLVDGCVALGHRRLAILDLSEAGHQPMHSLDGNASLVFNGEVYNYLELREELRAKGHRFVSNTDTEVILAAYSEWGAECVSRFNGMWAFALYDRRLRRIFCSRDRFGIKPFYYASTDQAFVFGSETKQLLPFLPARRARRDMLLNFLVTGLNGYSEETFFEGVFSLPGGHNLVLDLQTGAFTITRFYEIHPAETEGKSEDELADQFYQLLTDSIRLRLRSDVPVGTCLSGGLDSSTIAMIAAREYVEKAGRPFTAVTAASIDPENDETEFARQVVEAGKMAWHLTRPQTNTFLGELPELVFHQDEPFGGLSVMMSYQVMKIAREAGLPVLLDGQGSDEVLFGYPMQMGALIINALKRRGPVAALATFFQLGRRDPQRTARFRLLSSGAFLAPRWRFQYYVRNYSALREQPECPPAFLAWSDSVRDLAAYQKTEITSTVLPSLLRFEDRNSMASSIETRLPFLDYRLVEFGVGLKTSLKVRDGWSKYILRKTAAQVLPASIAWRPSKIGFAAPVSVLQQGVLASCRDVVRECPVLRDVIDMEKYLHLESSQPEKAWRYCSVALWAQTFAVRDIA
jgi:asparagine synthase (glutamine-hydrolysing)